MQTLSREQSKKAQSGDTSMGSLPRLLRRPEFPLVAQSSPDKPSLTVGFKWVQFITNNLTTDHEMIIVCTCWQSIDSLGTAKLIWVNIKECDCWIIRKYFFVKKLPNCLARCLYHLTFPPAMMYLPVPSPAFDVVSV